MWLNDEKRVKAQPPVKTPLKRFIELEERWKNTPPGETGARYVLAVAFGNLAHQRETPPDVFLRAINRASDIVETTDFAPWQCKTIQESVEGAGVKQTKGLTGGPLGRFQRALDRQGERREEKLRCQRKITQF